jgi:hypothetical protein
MQNIPAVQVRHARSDVEQQCQHLALRQHSTAQRTYIQQGNMYCQTLAEQAVHMRSGV